MAITITTDAEAPGKSAIRPAMVQSPRMMKFVTGQIDFDSSYPTGGGGHLLDLRRVQRRKRYVSAARDPLRDQGWVHVQCRLHQRKSTGVLGGHLG